MMDHSQTLDIITSAVKDHPIISALFLAGSHATGHADDFSDVDLIVIADDGATDEVAKAWRSIVGHLGEIILWWDRAKVPVLINAITADWTRIDATILKPRQLSGHAQDRLVPLVDPGDLYNGLKPKTEPALPSTAQFQYQIEEFIRILGLLPLGKGRQEFNNGVLGVFHLRNLLVDLLIAETAEPVRGGLLHLNRLITKEQQDLLASMPAAKADWDSLVTCHIAYAAAYLPKARQRADALQIDWPVRFEDVTWRMLSDRLGIPRPYGQD